MLLIAVVWCAVALVCWMAQENSTTTDFLATQSSTITIIFTISFSLFSSYSCFLWFLFFFDFLLFLIFFLTLPPFTHPWYFLPTPLSLQLWFFSLTSMTINTYTCTHSLFHNQLYTLSLSNFNFVSLLFNWTRDYYLKCLLYFYQKKLIVQCKGNFKADSLCLP